MSYKENDAINQKIRIAGYNVHLNKKLPYALTAIFGIGYATGVSICQNLNFNIDHKTKDLNEEQIIQLTQYITTNIVIGEDLKKQIIRNKKKLIAINCRRGIRLRLGYTCRGQKTRSNARTAKKLNNKYLN